MLLEEQNKKNYLITHQQIFTNSLKLLRNLKTTDNKALKPEFDIKNGLLIKISLNTYSKSGTPSKSIVA